MDYEWVFFSSLILMSRKQAMHLMNTSRTFAGDSVAPRNVINQNIPNQYASLCKFY